MQDFFGTGIRFKKSLNVARSALLCAVTASSLVALSAIPAKAFTYRFTYDLDSTSESSRNSPTGASARVDFRIPSNTRGDKVSLNLFVKNTTNGTFGRRASSSKLTGIAFNLPNGITIDENNVALSKELDKFKKDIVFRSFSDEKISFDFAFADNNNFFGGNPNGALSENARPARINLLLNMNRPDPERAYERLFNGFNRGRFKVAARFQDVDRGRSDSLLGGTVIDRTPKGVPEPGILAGLGVMSASFFRVTRARQRHQSSSK